MRKILFIILFQTVFLFAGKATQSQILESANIVSNAYQGIALTDHLTPHLVILAQNQNIMSPGEIEELEKFGLKLNRSANSLSFTTRDTMDYYIDSGIFRIHYDTEGVHAIDSTDSNQNGVPDYLDIVLNALIETENTIINNMGYSLPPDDDFDSSIDDGGSGHYDIYVQNIGSEYYGWTQPDYLVYDNPNSYVTEKNAATSYMVIRNNYDGFPNSLEGNIQVTLAHEFFHAIQFGYDYEEEPWLMEATSTWMEDQVFTHVNDCYYYLPGWFKYPHYSLNDDISSHSWYGSFIFFQYISENIGEPDLIRKIWEESIIYDSSINDYSFLTIDDALKNNSSSMNKAMNGMVVANKMMTASTDAAPFSYVEANGYNVAPAIWKTIDFVPGETYELNDSTLNSYGSRYININTDSPVLATIYPGNDFSEDISLFGIMEFGNGNFWVFENGASNSVNIEPGTDTKNISFAIASNGASSGKHRYSLVISSGKSLEHPFFITKPQPSPFMVSRYVSTDFKILIYDDQDIEVSVVKKAGGKIRSLANRQFTAGIYNFSWDGKNDNGDLIKSGSYFIKVSDNVSGESVYRILTLISSSEISSSNPYPNPSNNSFSFSVINGTTQKLTVKVIDLSGKTVSTLADRYYTPGVIDFHWDGYYETGEKAPSGIYFIGTQGELENDFRKITLIR